LLEHSHWGLILSNKVDKKSFIQVLLSKKAKGILAKFNDLNGVLFSDIAVDAFVKKEHTYQSVEITKSQNRPLITFSSGERKKIYLAYCIERNPDYIIIDNPFDHLDQLSRLHLTEQLGKLSRKVTFIQLSNRAEETLSFIKNRGTVEDNTFAITSSLETNEKSITTFEFELPESLFSFQYQSDTLVKFENVSVDYSDKPVVKAIDWEIKSGEFWQLIGPNGSGKSTLLSLITGDNPKAYGQQVTLFGTKKGSGESVWGIKKKIGYFSINMTELFNKSHTVEQMLLAGFFDSIGLYEKPSKLQEQRVAQWLEIIEMSHLKKVRFNRLTLGEQRLVMLVRAMVKQPPLLILDEPVEGLDEANTNLVIQLINRLIQSAKVCVIYVSHRLEPTLLPTCVYELIPSEKGSLGKVKRA
tara:strand:- start:23671 stop:24909 length:1239 start_codon:yes stop_codon:yes gene_type:complete